MTIDRPSLTIRKANGVKINTIYNAKNIKENFRYGEINTLTFDVPYYLLDGNGNIIPDQYGLPQKNPKIDILIAEYIVEIEDRVYIIKVPTETKDMDNVKQISVECEEMAGDLGFKQVKYLNLYPPYSNPVDPKRAILEIITYPYQKDLGYGGFSAVSGTSLTLDLDTTFDFTGYYIAILDGTGKYQQRKIVSYSTATKVAVVDSVFSPQVDVSTSVFRIHNSRFLLGDVDADIMIVDGSPVYRALQFEDTTIQEGLYTIRTRFGGNLVYSIARDETENRYFVTVGLKNNNGASGYEFRYKKNINGISRKVDSSNSCYTRVYPEGRNNLSVVSVATDSRTDSGVTYNSHELGKGDIYNFQYYLGLGYTIDECYDLFVKDFRFIEDAYVDADDLYLGASQALEELSIPKISYAVSGFDFSKVNLDIFKGVQLIELHDGDIIHVIDEELGIDFNATVIELDRNYDEPYKPQIKLSNFTDTLGDIYAKIIKYQEGYSQRKSLYGKSATIVIADRATSRNWRYADYVVPDDGTKTADEILQHAIDEITLESNGGGIYLAEGNYGFANPVNNKQNVNVNGYGDATRIYPIGSISSAFVHDNIKNASVRNLLIDYNRDTDGETPLSYFYDGIKIENGCDNILITECTIEKVENKYLYVEGSSNVNISLNAMQSLVTTFTGINVVDLVECNNVSLYDNRIIGKISTDVSSGAVIKARDTVVSNTGEFFIENNYISVTEENRNCIDISANEDLYISISDNMIITDGSNGSFNTVINIGNIKSYDCYNNTIKSTVSTAGISTKGLVGVIQNGGIRNNTLNISLVTSPTIGAGILIYNDTDGAIIQNNKVAGGNPYDTVSTSTLAYGCLIGGSSADDNIVSGNDFSENTTTSFLDLGTNTIIFGGNKL